MNITNEIILGDCLEIIPNISDQFFDLIIIDPPFLIANYYAIRKFMKKSFGDMGLIEHFFKKLYFEFERVLKPTGSFYIFCNTNSFPLFWFYTFSFTKKLRTIIWDKGTSINGYSWRHQHDLILFGEMPEYPKVKTGDGDVIKCKSVPLKERLHPAQKPIELIKKFILKSSKEGDLVADFFAGSGTTLIASKELNRNYFGIEYDKKYYEICLERLGK